MKKEIWERPVTIAPSLITMDMCNLEQQCALIEKCGLDTLHVDILDGHFSPSMPLGLDTVKQLRNKTNLEFDAHVMTTAPQFYIEELIEAGASQIVFHVETCDHIDGTINFIHSAGIRAGVALKPATPLSVLDYVLEKCDAVLLMLINPGYAQVKGEAQAVYAARKIHELHARITAGGLKTQVVLDGRISPQNIAQYGGSGEANLFVAGSTCIQKDDQAGSLRTLKKTQDRLNAQLS